MSETKEAKEVKEKKEIKEKKVQNNDKKEEKTKKPAKNSQQKNIISPSEIKSGMVIKIYQKIKEVNPKGETKERLQFFEGTVLARKNGNEPGATITVRKVSNGVGVEKIFPLFSPTIAKVELLQKIKTRRAKLYFLRRGYKKRLKKEKIAG
ncbi:50S ribosomal protein L19 [Candidatus Parcubacteria bacterium]|nr:50S ribosomal protein L19 [Candidatus Parcubacteria bacterium]